MPVPWHEPPYSTHKHLSRPPQSHHSRSVQGSFHLEVASSHHMPWMPGRSHLWVFRAHLGGQCLPWPALCPAISFRSFPPMLSEVRPRIAVSKALSDRNGVPDSPLQHPQLSPGLFAAFPPHWAWWPMREMAPPRHSPWLCGEITLPPQGPDYSLSSSDGTQVIGSPIL